MNIEPGFVGLPSFDLFLCSSLLPHGCIDWARQLCPRAPGLCWPLERCCSRLKLDISCGESWHGQVLSPVFAMAKEAPMLQVETWSFESCVRRTNEIEKTSGREKTRRSVCSVFCRFDLLKG